MSKRNVRLILTDILEAVDKVDRYTAGLTYEEFERNEMPPGCLSRTSF